MSRHEGTAMKTIEVGLASRSASISLADLRPVVAALDQQARLDVGPVWGVSARVSLLDDPDKVPKGVSPIILMDELPGSMHGVHTVDHNVPFAIVLAAQGWSLAVSHEFVEMLVDPSGSRVIRGRKMEIKDGAVHDTDDHVDYIVEASDPVEDESFAYTIDSVLVSDFYSPRYFDDAVTPGVRYSHSGKITRPREVGRNGYLSWRDPQLKQLRQLRFFDTLEILTLSNQPGAATEDGAQSMRRVVDSQTETPRLARMRQRRLVQPSLTYA
jgi:hypothetical protein